MKTLKLFCALFVCGVLASFSSHANLCEQRAFGEESDFVSQAMAHQLLAKGEWPVYELEFMNQMTSHWLKEEAEAFFNFFLRRVGRQTLMERLKSPEDFSFISFQDFMEKKRFYDSLHPGIVPTALKRSFAGFRQADSLEDIKDLVVFLKKHIGKEALSYLLTNLPLQLFFQDHDPRQSFSFVLDYTRRHKADIKPLEERIQQGLLFKNLQIRDIKELFASSVRLDYTLRRENKTVSAFEWEQKIKLFLLFLQELFEAVLKTPVHALKETVQVLELYMPPEEISGMMTQPMMFQARAPQLKESISLMEKTYNFQARLSPASFKTLSQNPTHHLPPLKIQALFEPPEKDPPAFIRWLVKTHPENMLSETEPLRLKQVLKILENQLGKGLLALSFQNFDKAWAEPFIDGFFEVEWENLQKISLRLDRFHLDRTMTKGLAFQTRTFFKRSRPTPAGMLIWAYLDKMTFMDELEELEAFLKSLRILHRYIVFGGQPAGIKSFFPSGPKIFTVQLMDILRVSDRLSFSEVAQDMGYLEQAFRRQLPQLLREKSVLEIIPSFHREEVERERFYEDMGLKPEPPGPSLFTNTFGEAL